MFARLLSVILFALFLAIFDVSAGAPDGQPFANCPEGMQCIMGGGQPEAPPAEFGVEQLHLTSPANGEVKMSLSNALKIISKMPVPPPGDGSVFDRALWTLYVKDVFNELKLAVGAGRETAPPPDLPTRIAQLNREVRTGEARIRELRRELGRLKKLNRRR